MFKVSVKELIKSSHQIKAVVFLALFLPRCSSYCFNYQFKVLSSPWDLQLTPLGELLIYQGRLGTWHLNGPWLWPTFRVHLPGAVAWRLSVSVVAVTRGPTGLRQWWGKLSNWRRRSFRLGCPRGHLKLVQSDEKSCSFGSRRDDMGGIWWGYGEGPPVGLKINLVNHSVTRIDKARSVPGCAWPGWRTADPNWGYRRVVERALWVSPQSSWHVLHRGSRVWGLEEGLTITWDFPWDAEGSGHCGARQPLNEADRALNVA